MSRVPVDRSLGRAGFLTMVLAQLVASRNGRVVAIDLFERQVEHARRDTAAVRPDLAGRCTFLRANAFECIHAVPRTRDSDGGADARPVIAWAVTSDERFDAIAVAAQCDAVPQNLVRLLKPGGRLVCPLGKIVPIDSDDPDRFQPFAVVEASASEGAPATVQRGGPISVNFLPCARAPGVQRACRRPAAADALVARLTRPVSSAA
jgi:SAM-dependent methyltransferase